MNKKKYIVTLAGAVMGAAAGYLYYHYIGCESGSCAITSSPFNSTIYGAVMGWLLTGILLPDKNRQNQNTYEQDNN